MSQYILLWETKRTYYYEKLREHTIMRNNTYYTLYKRTYYDEKQREHTTY